MISLKFYADRALFGMNVHFLYVEHMFWQNYDNLINHLLQQKKGNRVSHNLKLLQQKKWMEL